MEKRRVQFEFSDQLVNEIDGLCQKLGFSTRTEFVRHAIRFLQWTYAEVQEKNGRLVIDRNGKQLEILFPFWIATDNAVNAVEHTITTDRQ